MSIYAVDKLMAETKRLAAEYHRVTGQVLPVSNELSQYYVSKSLDFTIPNTIEKGVDLIGSGQWHNAKIQVKSRVIFDNAKSRQMVGKVNMSGAWEAVALVLMNPEYEAQEIYLVNRDVLEKATLDITHKSCKYKSTISVAKFKAISDKVWSSI